MIKITGLNLKLRSFALRDIDLEIESGDYFILVGPSGSGKTVLLETVAGLHKANSGKIAVDGQDITSLDPEKRNIGIVYQDCALFPHLTVKENIIFGLKVRKKPPPQIERELDRIVQLLGIGYLLSRKALTISGGEKQRVALARALVTKPQLLLLDEPLSALDPLSRESMRNEIMKIHRELGISVLHVTHDFEEAITMGTRIAVIGGGIIRQIGTPDEIFRHPDSEFVARFTMAENIFSGTARKNGDGSTVFCVEGLKLISDSGIEGPCYATIRPENIFISDTVPADGAYVYRGPVTQIVNKGSIVNVAVDLQPVMTGLMTRHSFDKMNLSVGQEAYLTVPPESVYLF